MPSQLAQNHRNAFALPFCFDEYRAETKPINLVSLFGQFFISSMMLIKNNEMPTTTCWQIILTPMR
jgi:hypothetical protein